MPKRHLIIYCDESTERGEFYSHFYGGALIDAPHREAIEKVLNERKAALNLHRELKWTKISQAYEKKYKDFLDTYFDLVKEGLIKVRIMFTQNIHIPQGLTEYQIDNQYFLLYYHFIKHAFGLRHCNPGNLDEVFIALYLDDPPDSAARFDGFKDYVQSLCAYPIFSQTRVMIPKMDIAGVRSHEHVVLQGLDIVLGAMQFRLNNLHLAKAEGKRFRGKRTRTKERIYKHINKRIQEVYPRFNIGGSTGTANGPSDRWDHSYRHWRFIPSDYQLDLSRGKKGRK